MAQQGMVDCAYSTCVPSLGCASVHRPVIRPFHLYAVLRAHRPKVSQGQARLREGVVFFCSLNADIGPRLPTTYASSPGLPFMTPGTFWFGFHQRLCAESSAITGTTRTEPGPPSSETDSGLSNGGTTSVSSAASGYGQGICRTLRLQLHQRRCSCFMANTVDGDDRRPVTTGLF